MAKEKKDTTEKKTAPRKTTAKKTVKKEAAEAKANEPVELKQEEVVYTRSQLDQIVAAAVAKALEEQAAKQPNVVKVSTDAPVVKLRYQCECSPVNVIRFGPNGKFGSITGKTGVLTIPKEAFLGEFRDNLAQKLLATRELLVIDGLTDEEREMYGVSYKKGEYMDEKAFAKMVDMGEEILDIYPDLNDTYKLMVAKRFAEEYEKNPKKIARSIVVKLNAMSKKDAKDLPKGDPRKNGAFAQVIEAMNEADISGDEE